VIHTYIDGLPFLNKKVIESIIVTINRQKHLEKSLQRANDELKKKELIRKT